MDRLSLWKEKVEKRLREVFRPKGPEVLREAMAYYLFQEGKRVRPITVVAVATSLGGDEEDAVTVGCVIEMIHNYSLIHDDLPAMDNDDFRRGLPTCHRKFGEAVAILAGDALLTYAFEVLLTKENFRTLSSETLIEIGKVISEKAGPFGLVGGQVLDIKGWEDRREVNLKKTAALFEACFLAGGLVAGRRDIFGDLEEAGRLTGLLFQTTDDILDRDGIYKALGEEEALKEAEELFNKACLKVKDTLGEDTEVLRILEKIYSRVT